jgi:hypothetical protein
MCVGRRDKRTGQAWAVVGSGNGGREAGVDGGWSGWKNDESERGRVALEGSAPCPEAVQHQSQQLHLYAAITLGSLADIRGEKMMYICM